MASELVKEKDFDFKNLYEDSISLEIPSRAEYVSVSRLTLVSIANRLGFDIDDIEDMKVAISEACTNAIIHGNDDSLLNIKFNILKDGLEIVVKDKGKGFSLDSLKEPNLDELNEGGLGIFIIKSLMDKVSMKSLENEGTQIKMSKFLR